MSDTDTLRPAGALDGWAGRFAELPDSVAILAEPFNAMVAVRTADPAALEGLVGAPLPGPNAWKGGERVTAIHKGTQISPAAAVPKNAPARPA